MPTVGFQGASRHGSLDASRKSGASSAASQRADAGRGGRERGPEGPLLHSTAP